MIIVIIDVGLSITNWTSASKDTKMKARLNILAALTRLSLASSLLTIFSGFSRSTYPNKYLMNLQPSQPKPNSSATGDTSSPPMRRAP